MWDGLVHEEDIAGHHKTKRNMTKILKCVEADECIFFLCPFQLITSGVFLEEFSVRKRGELQFLTERQLM